MILLKNLKKQRKMLKIRPFIIINSISAIVGIMAFIDYGHMNSSRFLLAWLLSVIAINICALIVYLCIIINKTFFKYDPSIDDPTQKHQTLPRYKSPPPTPPTANKIKSDEFLVNENFVESKEFLYPDLNNKFIYEDENSIRRLALFFYKNKKDKLASELIDIADKYDER